METRWKASMGQVSKWDNIQSDVCSLCVLFSWVVNALYHRVHCVAASTIAARLSGVAFSLCRRVIYITTWCL